MFGRFVFLVLLFLIVYLGVKRLRVKLDESPLAKSKRSQSKKAGKISEKMMVKCQYCGLHIPEKEAIKQGDNIFCSLKHAEQMLQKNQ